LKIFANRVRLSIVKPILLCLLLILFAFYLGTWVLGVFLSLPILVLFVWIIKNRIELNREETPSVYVENGNFYCCDGHNLWEIPIENIGYAKGKNKKYLHFFVGFISWGTYNYGKLKLFYLDGDSETSLTLKYILDPVETATTINIYLSEIEDEAEED